MDLIQEAKNRGYRKGTAIRYVAHALDYVEGSYFETKGNTVVAFKKPKHERKGIDDEKFDTLFDGVEWVEIVDPSKRSQEQIQIDNKHDVYNR